MSLTDPGRRRGVGDHDLVEGRAEAALAVIREGGAGVAPVRVLDRRGRVLEGATGFFSVADLGDSFRRPVSHKTGAWRRARNFVGKASGHSASATGERLRRPRTPNIPKLARFNRARAAVSYTGTPPARCSTPIPRFDLTRPHPTWWASRWNPRSRRAALELVPAWLPGAYKIFDNARNLRGFQAETPGGAPLRFERVGWQTWRVSSAVWARGCATSSGTSRDPPGPAGRAPQPSPRHAGPLRPRPPGGLAGHPRVAAGRLAHRHRHAGPGATTFRAAHYEVHRLPAGCFATAEFQLDGVCYEVVYEGATAWDPAEVTCRRSRPS